MRKCETQMAARVLKAMGHPVRLGILDRLRRGERTVGDLEHELGCAQSTASLHIQVLERRGLVCSRRQGRSKYCSLRNGDVLSMVDCIRLHVHQCLPARGCDFAKGSLTQGDK